MKINRRHLFTVILFGVFVFLSRCSASSDGPGSCTLSCGGAQIAPAEARIRLLAQPAVACDGAANGTDYPQSVPVPFVIEKTVPSYTDATDTNTIVSTIPLAGVSFEPLIVGGLMAANPNDPSQPSKYKGIFTDQSEWCTDSCGNGLIELVPLCFTNGQSVILGLHSGNVGTAVSIVVGP